VLNGAGALVNNAQEARGWFDTANPDIANRGFFFAVEGAAQSFAGGAASRIMCQFVPNLPLNSGGSVDVLFGVEARSLRVYNRHDKTRSFTGSTGAHGSTLRRHNAHALQGVRMRRQ
jgi:hypothetical protein